MNNTILKATIVCGTLDIVYAMLMAIFKGGSAINVFYSVASGPFGDNVREWGIAAAALGLVVHFLIMLVMVIVYVKLLKYWLALGRVHFVILGSLYGLLLYFIMYWIVLSLRWPAVFPQTEPMQIIRALIPHIFLVGIPLAFIVQRKLSSLDLSIK
jgi:hypothetical protein